MIEKLPPPYLEGALKAQYGDTLCIPFAPNRAVNIVNATHGMQARIKTIATNRIVAQLKSETFAKAENHPDYDVTFDLEDVTLTPGQYYKIQLAFDNGILGYYSTVGVFKYTTQPTITIDKLDQTVGNLYTYTGVYTNEDVTEKVYSYRFYVIQTKTDTLIADSGVLIHDSSNDPVDSSSDTWILNQQLIPGMQYTITYEVTTINGLQASSSHTIVNNEIADDGLLTNCIIEPELDFNNGRIQINLKTLTPLKGEGGFVLSRADSKDNYETWYEVMTFTLQSNSVLPDKLWTDYTVEQGVGYKYGLQRFNDAGFFTKRLTNKTPIIADFEDIFLYDGYRQLRVRFNPKITSFKNTVLETKVDTIGGKYPFIFRNGDVRYKEFPISGLISYLSDPDELFMSNMELGFIEEHAHRHSTEHTEALQSSIRGTQVDTVNIAAERTFKMRILDWLTNGQIKLFRSPAEGNYIVRTMNTSLSPNDTLGRMIHTFNATAYEIAENNFTNLVKYGFIQDVKIGNKIMVHSSLDLNYKNIPYHNLLQDYPNGVYEATFVGVPAGTIFTLQFLNTSGGVDIYIPNNGRYKVNIYDEPLISVKLKSLPEGLTKLSGLLDISYYTNQGVGDFSNIRKVMIIDYSSTYIGESGRGVSVNMIEKFENVKHKFGYVYSLHVENREIKKIYVNNNKYYTSSTYDNEVTFNPNYLYYIENDKSTSLRYLDGADKSLTRFTYPNYVMNIAVAGGATQEIVIGAHNQAGYYTLPSVESIDYLSLGNGLIGTIMCQRKEYIYCIEEDNAEVAKAYKQWKAGTMSDTNYFKLLAKHGIKEE